jgi:hypothetical protein
MEIEKVYKINNNKFKFVYSGLCDNIKTKWITKSEWDFKIKIRSNKELKEIEYFDSNDEIILVFEYDEEDYYKY